MVFVRIIDLNLLAARGSIAPRYDIRKMSLVGYAGTHLSSQHLED